jgi:hypothetical protein
MSVSLLTITRIVATLAATLGLALTGCKARELGSNYADTQSATVDNSWVTAVGACWPAVAHQSYSTEAIKHYLADPIHFRAAFAVYAPFTDEMLRSVVAAPVSNAPAPDTSVLVHSVSPVLTRAQALAGAKNASNGTPGTDSLCSIQPGLPVGFR